MSVTLNHFILEISYLCRFIPIMLLCVFFSTCIILCTNRFKKTQVNSERNKVLRFDGHNGRFRHLVSLLFDVYIHLKLRFHKSDAHERDRIKQRNFACSFRKNKNNNGIIVMWWSHELKAFFFILVSFFELLF